MRLTVDLLLCLSYCLTTALGSSEKKIVLREESALGMQRDFRFHLFNLLQRFESRDPSADLTIGEAAEINVLNMILEFFFVKIEEGSLETVSQIASTKPGVSVLQLESGEGLLYTVDEGLPPGISNLDLAIWYRVLERSRGALLTREPLTMSAHAALSIDRMIKSKFTEWFSLLHVPLLQRVDALKLMRSGRASFTSAKGRTLWSDSDVVLLPRSIPRHELKSLSFAYTACLNKGLAGYLSCVLSYPFDGANPERPAPLVMTPSPLDLENNGILLAYLMNSSQMPNYRTIANAKQMPDLDFIYQRKIQDNQIFSFK